MPTSLLAGVDAPWAPAILPLVVAATACTAAVPATIWLARRTGAMAMPDGDRHLHPQPTPRLGGLAMVAGFALALAAALTQRGIRLVTGGTDNHLMLIDLRPHGLRGKEVQAAFDEVGITLNKNAFRGHGGTPFNPNGLRLGTPTVTTRGMGPAEMVEIAGLIAELLEGLDDTALRASVRTRSLALCRRFPLAYRGA